MVKRRLDNPNDFVRVEIAAALHRDIPVIPILLEGAKIPKPAQLPEELEDLSVRNGLEVRHASFHSDMDRLIQSIKKIPSNRKQAVNRRLPHWASENFLHLPKTEPQ